MTILTGNLGNAKDLDEDDISIESEDDVVRADQDLILDLK